jgi:spoIIIJ-associated protein
MPWITEEGRTVEEAQQAAVARSGLPEAELDIEIVNEGAKGLFGLGGEPAVVRVRPKDEATDFRHAFRDDITPSLDESASVQEREDAPAGAPDRTRAPERESDEAGDEIEDVEEAVAEKRPLSERQEEAAQLGAEIVRGILERMNIEGEINTRIAGGTVYVEVFGEEMGILIGRGGTTLEALQELVRAGIQRRLKTRQAVVVDVEAYWERRRKPQRRDPNERREGSRRGGRRARGRGGEGREPREPREPDGNR